MGGYLLRAETNNCKFQFANGKLYVGGNVSIVGNVPN